MHKIDVTVFQAKPFLVDMDSETNAGYRAYVDKPSDPSFSIGRESDTGPGDVGSEIDNPSGGIDNPAFPAGSSVGHPGNPNANVMSVILAGSGGSQENKERVGAFYVTTKNGGESVKITAIKIASQGNIILNVNIKAIFSFGFVKQSLQVQRICRDIFDTQIYIPHIIK